MNEDPEQISYAPYPFAGDLSEHTTTKSNTTQEARTEAAQDVMSDTPGTKGPTDGYPEFVGLMKCIMMIALGFTVVIGAAVGIIMAIVTSVLTMFGVSAHQISIVQSIVGALLILLFAGILLIRSRNE